MAFENGPFPVDEDASLWRYIRFPAFFLHLQGRVFLPSVSKLQQGDCREGCEWWDEVEATIGLTDQEYGQLRKWYFDNHVPPQERKLNEGTPQGERNYQREVFREYYEILRKRRFAWCWFDSKQKHESYSMWEIYGRGGIAIRSSIKSLKAALPQADYDWLATKMHYLELQRLYPYALADNGGPIARQLVRRPYLAKGVEYLSEREVRLVTAGSANEQGLVLENISPDAWMEEIVTSPHLPKSEFEAFKDAVSKLCPSLQNRIRPSRLFEGPEHAEQQNARRQETGRQIDKYFEDDSSRNLPEFMKRP